jgi:glycine betaine/proline transport system substrate-binding protein
MKSIKTLFLSTVLSLSFGAFVSANAGGHSACGKVTIAEMTWQSAAVLAHLDAKILSSGYGCDVELVPGDTMPTGTSMIEKGEPDIAPELWTNGLGPLLAPAVAEGRIASAGESIKGGALESWWIPAYMLDDHPELATIEGVLANPQLFPDPEDPSMAAVHGCPAGWNCQITSGQLFKAADMASKGWNLVDPGSGAGLAGAMAEAYNKGDGWIGYYWGPTAILGQVDMVQVDMGPHDPAEWDRCIGATPDCPDPKLMNFPVSTVEIYVSKKIMDNDTVMDYLGKRGMTSGQISGILAAADADQLSPQEAAEYILRERGDLWENMVSSDAADKIKASL